MTTKKERIQKLCDWLDGWVKIAEDKRRRLKVRAEAREEAETCRENLRRVEH